MMMRISFFVALLLTLLAPELKLQFFAPFLTLLVLKKTPETSLIAAFFIGLFEDFLSDSTLLGVLALGTTFSCFLLIRFKTLFFSDRQETIPLMCALFSLSQTMQTLLFFSHGIKFSFLSELLLFPLFDTLYALPFSYPLFLFKKRVTR